MIIVQETFICKPGNASKLAKLLKNAMGGNEELLYVLTDVTGSFNKVVIVSRFENLSAFENRMDKYIHNEEEAIKIKEMMKGYEEMYITGGREIYQSW